MDLSVFPFISFCFIFFEALSFDVYISLSYLLVGCSFYHYVVSLLLLLKWLVILFLLKSTLLIIILPLLLLKKKISIYMYVCFHTLTLPVVFKVNFFGGEVQCIVRSFKKKTLFRSLLIGIDCLYLR